MDTEQHQRAYFWVYVAIFGALWGGLELTLGTFLHTLRVPKTGLMMVTLSAVLMTAQRTVYPVRGSTLATGVVAACLKSLSPGGVILGPIVGILSEALVMEFCMLFSRHMLVCGLAGGLAVFVSQMQSVFKMWLYYGNDFFHAAMRVVTKFLRLESTAALGWSFVALFMGIVLGIGFVAGIIGNRWGRRVLREISKNDAAGISLTAAEMPLLPGPQIKSASEIPLGLGQNKRWRCKRFCERAIATRRLVAPVALITLVMQFGGELWLMLSATGIFLATLWFLARPVLLSLWWPKFWLLTLVVSLLGGFILAWELGGSPNFELGAQATARMISRGLYVFSLVSWATHSLRPEEVLTFWQRIGLPKMGEALTQAYGLLPAWLDRFNALLAKRPGGLRPMLRYIRNAALLCIIEATRQAQVSGPILQQAQAQKDNDETHAATKPP